MNLPINHKDLVEEIYICIDKYKTNGYQPLFQLISILDKVDDEIIIDAIVHIIEKRNHFREHQYCGLILEKVNPTTNKSLEEILDRILSTWNKSVEQIPFWMEIQFGRQKVVDTFRQLELELASEKMLDNLLTMKWWLKIDLER